jgi:hypothetical protein
MSGGTFRCALHCSFFVCLFFSCSFFILCDLAPSPPLPERMIALV